MTVLVKNLAMMLKNYGIEPLDMGKQWLTQYEIKNKYPSHDGLFFNQQMQYIDVQPFLFHVYEMRLLKYLRFLR